MQIESEPFDWEPDSSKGYIMSTSQELISRQSYIDYSSVVPTDWASVVERFQQQKSP
jgi:hypothetical protein